MRRTKTKRCFVVDAMATRKPFRIKAAILSVVYTTCIDTTRGVATWGGGGVSHPQKIFKNRENSGKLRETNGKFCHKWQHLCLLVHPIKFGQFYKNSIFGRFNEHTPPPHPKSKWFRDAPGHYKSQCIIIHTYE